MAHFAKLDENNIVTRTEVVSNDIAVSEEDGIQYLKDLYNEPNAVWKQTSYNTRSGVHLESDNATPSADQSKALRMNFAGPDYTYDESRDAFIPPKPFPSFTLNETTCTWQSPVPNPGAPDNEHLYSWNEETLSWILME